MPSCIRKTVQVFRITKAIVTRLLFGLHGLVCIWRVTLNKHQSWYWCLVASLILLIAETVITLKKKKGGEWKWFCPSVFLYLTSTLPAIWLLELDLLDRRIRHKQSKLKAPRMEPNDVSLIFGKINLHLHPNDWVKILEQLLLLVLIIGRWLLPKGEITREQLSQLLLVYIGMAADIIELFEAFKEKEVRYNRQLTLIILSLWTASLLQFCFVLSAAKARKSRPSFTKQPSRRSISDSGRCFTCRSEILSIMTTIVLQDGSFLVLRMILIFRYNVVSYTNIFFTAKNTLVNVLQLYRLVVLYAESVKLIKRQKSDSSFNDVFLVKAGDLASKIAREEQTPPKRACKHKHVQTEFFNPSDVKEDDTTAVFNETEANASFPDFDTVVIENPMNSVTAGEQRMAHERVVPKSKDKRKESDCKSLAPGLMNVTMVYLNPALKAEDIRNMSFPEPDKRRGGCLPVTKSGIEMKREFQDASVVSEDEISGNSETPAEPNKSETLYNSVQSLKTPKTCQKSDRETFKAVVKEIIRKGNYISSTGPAEASGVNRECSERLFSSEDVINLQSESNQDKSVCMDGPVSCHALEISTDVSDTDSSLTESIVGNTKYSKRDSHKLQDTTLSKAFTSSPKKTRWRWRRAKAIGRKKCSDLNQNSTEHVSQDIELQRGGLCITEEKGAAILKFATNSSEPSSERHSHC